MTEPGFPLDDAWIYQVFARNIAQGQGFAFNPGQPISGTTAPLWTLLMGLLWPLAGPIASALILGIALEWLALIAVYKIARLLTGDESLAFATLLACALCWVLTWGALSGMEVGLYSTLSLWGLYIYLKTESFGHSRNYLVYFLFALAVVARPECALFLAAAVICDFLEWRRLPQKMLLPWLARAAIVAAILTPYFAFNYWTTGSIFPQTFTAKTEEHGFFSALMAGDFKRVAKSLTLYPYVYLQDFLMRLLFLTPILMVAFITGAVKLVSLDGPLKSKGVMLLALVMLYVPAMGAFSPVIIGGTYHHMRLMDNIVPLIIAIGLAGLFWRRDAWRCPYAQLFIIAGLAFGAAGGIMMLADRFIVERTARYLVQDFSRYTARDFAIQARLVWDTGRNIIIMGFLITTGILLCGRKVQGAINSRPGMAIMLTAILGYMAVFALVRSDYYANDVRNINEMDKAVGVYLRGLNGEGRSVAVNDIGAIGYFSGMRILDLKGLITLQITPDMIRDDSLAFEYLLRHERVDYMAIFPEWFSYIPRRTDILRPIKYFTVGRNTILAGDTTIVYKADWPAPNRK